MRILRFLFTLSVFLDVAILPFSCVPKKDHGEVVIITVVDNYKGEPNTESSSLYFKRAHLNGYFKGDIINLITIRDVINNNYREEGKLEFKINRTYYLDENHNEVEIDLPYTVTGEDRVIYFEGNKDCIVLFVHIDVLW